MLTMCYIVSTSKGVPNDTGITLLRVLLVIHEVPKMRETHEHGGLWVEPLQQGAGGRRSARFLMWVLV